MAGVKLNTPKSYKLLFQFELLAYRIRLKVFSLLKLFVDGKQCVLAIGILHLNLTGT